MARMLQLTFGVSFLLCVVSLEGSGSAERGTEILRKTPKKNIKERFLETVSDDGQEQKIKNKRQDTKPPLVLKLLQEKLDNNPVSNHLGAYLVPSPVPFAVQQEQLYYPELQAHTSDEAGPRLPTTQLEEESVEDLKEPPPKYQYIYKVKDPDGNDFGHTEARVGDRTWGRYFVQLPDGREKTVRYWADDSGFHAEVIYTGNSQ